MVSPMCASRGVQAWTGPWNEGRVQNFGPAQQSLLSRNLISGHAAVALRDSPDRLPPVGLARTWLPGRPPTAVSHDGLCGLVGARGGEVGEGVVRGGGGRWPDPSWEGGGARGPPNRPLQ